MQALSIFIINQRILQADRQTVDVRGICKLYVKMVRNELNLP